MKENLLNFRLDKSNLNFNLIPVVNELIADKALQRIENEFKKQATFSCKIKDTEAINMKYRSDKIETENDFNDNKNIEHQIEGILF